MAFKDLFKKFRSAPEPIELEVIEFDSIIPWMDRRRIELAEKEGEVFVAIKEHVQNSREGIVAKIQNLKDYDLEAKKEDERYKRIVKKHREDYIENVEEFLGTLAKLEAEDKLEVFIEKVTKMFSVFEKKSNVNYERATILIGKEMAELKKSVISLSKYFRQIFNDNAELVEINRAIAFVLLEFEELENLKINNEKLIGELKSLEAETEGIEEKNKVTSEKLSDSKKSKKYLESLEQKQKLHDVKKEIDMDISRLKAGIDFKSLTNFFHKWEKEMRIVKLHKDNFHEGFNADDGAEIVRLLGESNQNKEAVVAHANRIKDKNEVARKIEDSIGEDIIAPLSRELQRLDEVNQRLRSDKERTERVIENISGKKRDLVSSVRDKLAKFVVVNVE
jgi:hypothetical protein